MAAANVVSGSSYVGEDDDDAHDGPTYPGAHTHVYVPLAKV